MQKNLKDILQNLHAPVKPRIMDNQHKKLISANLNLENQLKEKNREIDRLKNELQIMQSKLQDLSGTDILTQLPNRSFFRDYLIDSIRRALRVGYSLSILLIDIDKIGQINLKYGFETGDQVIYQIAQTIKSCVREIDLPARWGGEEFVVVLHETDSLGAINVANRITNKIEQLAIPDPKNNSPITISASIAIASCPQHGTDMSYLMESLGHSLLAIKESGKNGVTFAQEK